LRFVSDEYLACLIDTEGCIGLYLSNKTNLLMTVQFTNRYKPLCDMLKRRFGGSISSRKYERDKVHRQICHTWRCPQRHVGPFLKRILPFLVIKVGQAKLVLKAYKQVNSKKRSQWIPLTREELRDRKALVKEVKRLNKRSILN
jgi:hypothetical protein